MLLNPLEIPDWDTQLAAAFPDATVFHTAAWARVLAETYGHRPSVVLQHDDREERGERREERGCEAKVGVRSPESGIPIAQTSSAVPSSDLRSATSDLRRAVALLPLYEVRSLFTGRRGVCVPFADFCGPLVKTEKREERRGERGCDSGDEDRSAICDLRSAIIEPSLPSLPAEAGRAKEGSLSSLLEESLDLGSKRNWAYLEWRGGWSPPDATPSTVLLSHDLDLRPDESKLQANVESSVRRALRKAEKAGLEIEFRTDAAAMDEYYRLHCLTRKKHGLPPQPIRFFRKFQEHLVAKGMGFVALAFPPGPRRPETGDRSPGTGARRPEPGDRRPGSEARSPESGVRRPGTDGSYLQIPDYGLRTTDYARALRAIAGAVFLTFNGKALYKFGASDEQFLELRANNLLMWKAFLHCKQIGCTTVGMGRTEKEHEGLRRFKLGWGTVETEVPYFKLDARTAHWLPEIDRSKGWRHHLFRALPGFMSRWAGQLLYPHLD